MPHTAVPCALYVCIDVCTKTYTILHTESSTELCTGATAHTHKDKDHHRGRCRPVTTQIQGLVLSTRTLAHLDLPGKARLDNFDQTMIGYRHPPLRHS
jgi:uncharacterized protein YceK